MDDLRPLLYPLGLLSSLAFSSRVIIQWLSSEVHGRSHVTSIFWILSLVGNGLLFTHSVIQSQVHVALVQSANFVIALRNIDLMRSKQRLSFSFTFFLLIVALCFSAISTAIVSYVFSGTIDWIRIPQMPWVSTQQQHAPFIFHLFGVLGLLLFNCRFWIQWWMAERSGYSELSSFFWWISLLGGVLSVLYFGSINDPVNLIGPLFGIVAYSRNLILLRRTS